MNRPLVEIVQIDYQLIDAHASAHTEFNIKLSIKRKSSESMTVNGHFVAVTCIGRKPTHFLINLGSTLRGTASTDSLLVSDSGTQQSFQQQQQPLQPLSTPTLTQSQNQIQSITQKTEPHRGSLHGSIRRGSFDVRSIASENIRRTSLAKLSALPLEAPITKVYATQCMISIL